MAARFVTYEVFAAQYPIYKLRGKFGWCRETEEDRYRHPQFSSLQEAEENRRLRYDTLPPSCKYPFPVGLPESRREWAKLVSHYRQTTGHSARQIDIAAMILDVPTYPDDAGNWYILGAVSDETVARLKELIPGRWLGNCLLSNEPPLIAIGEAEPHDWEGAA